LLFYILVNNRHLTWSDCRIGSFVRKNFEQKVTDNQSVCVQLSASCAKGYANVLKAPSVVLFLKKYRV